MKKSVFLQGVVAVCFAATVSAASGQTNAIKLFGPVNVRTSTQGTGYGSKENVFNSTILNLSCSAPIQAVLSSSPNGSANVLADNFITLAVGSGRSVNICSNGTVENGNQHNCFTSSYSSQAGEGKLNGQDPDTFVSTGGVPAIDVSRYLTSGPVTATIGLVDTGGYLAGSTLYLVTNCTSNGVSGPGKITGNPISQSNPTDQQLAQSYPFNANTNQQVRFTYDLTAAQNAGSLNITEGTVPTTADIPLDPATFRAQYLHNTSFATANCLVHSGELTAAGNPACKLYTLTCQVGDNPNQGGLLCPESRQPNEIFQDDFDGPSFSFSDIQVPNGPTFHQGIGFLEAQDDWAGGPCQFNSQSSLAALTCPQNTITSFSGPGLYRSGGSGQSPNSTFIAVAPVPLDLTTVRVAGQEPGYWINSQTATVNFSSTPPVVPGSNTFVPSPIQSITYGISTSSSVPQPPPPVPDDIVVSNTIPCPTPSAPDSPPATVFTPLAQTVTVPSDGQYLLHYFAQDCAGTRELKFTQTAGNWSTSFFTYPINVDTVTPVIASGPTLSPAPSTNGGVSNSYLIGQKVSASYRCTDDRSGIVTCGTFTYAPGTTLNTGVLTSPIDTSKAGPGAFTVNAVDAAGNKTSASVSYVVVAQPVNLAILKLAPRTAKQGSQMIYSITVGNLGRQTASSVVVTDPLPSGVAFVKAAAQQLVCSNRKCSNPASCSFAGNTVSCSTPSLTLLTPVEIVITVKVQASVGTKVQNTATVSSSNPQGSPGNTQSTATTTVTR